MSSNTTSKYIPGGNRARYYRALATSLRERIHNEVIVELLVTGSSGYQPLLVEDKRCTHGYRVDRGVALSSRDTREYQRMLIERRDGLPAQSVVIDQQITHELAAGSQVVDQKAIDLAVRAGLDAGAMHAMLVAARTGTTPALPSGGRIVAPPPVVVDRRAVVEVLAESDDGDALLLSAPDDLEDGARSPSG